jgi:hypothetical protein
LLVAAVVAVVVRVILTVVLQTAVAVAVVEERVEQTPLAVQLAVEIDQEALAALEHLPLLAVRAVLVVVELLLEATEEAGDLQGKPLHQEAQDLEELVALL